MKRGLSLVLVGLMVEVLHHQPSSHHPNGVGEDIAADPSPDSGAEAGLGVRLPTAVPPTLDSFEDGEEERVEDGDGYHVGAVPRVEPTESLFLPDSA